MARLAGFLRDRLGPDDVPAVWRPGPDLIGRIALALDPADLEDARGGRPDAVFLHRPFRLPADALPGVAVLASHAGFDAHLTTGANPELAWALGLKELEPLEHLGRPVGMTGRLDAPISWASWLERVARQFGPVEASRSNGVGVVGRAGSVSSLTAGIVRSASEAGAAALLTGQLRAPALGAAAKLGLGLVAVGHRPAELWGLRRLARELREAFPALGVRILAG